MNPVRPLKDIEFIYEIVYLYNSFRIVVLSCVGGLTG